MKIRPKVRYVAYLNKAMTFPTWCVIHAYDGTPKVRAAVGESKSEAKRIAAALNLHEAVRRGEVKVSK